MTTFIEHLWRIDQAHSRMFRETCSTGSLTKAQFTALDAIRKAKRPISQKDITIRTGIDRSTLSAIVQLMVAAGYLHTETNPDDYRSHLLRLSLQGMKALHTASRNWRRAESDLLSALPITSRREFLNHVQRVEALASRM